MKKTLWGALLPLLFVVLTSCGTAAESDPLYVYAAGVAAHEDGITLSVLCVEKGREAGGGEKSDDNSPREAGTFSQKTFTGATVTEAFEQLWRSMPDDGVYAGTVRLYLLADDLTADERRVFAAYLLGSARLPLKASLAADSDPEQTLRRIAEAFSSEEWEKAITKDEGINVVTALREMVS